MKSVIIVVGTRPEIVKMAPVIRALKKHQVPQVFVHCGQHYDYNMSQQFIDELELPPPDYSLKIKACSQGVQTARIMAKMERLLEKTSPELVLVEGDTNGVLATALAAVKLGIPVGHVEAGLRSFDLRMPEEHNRRLTDHISTYLFAPTKRADTNLKRENVWGSIYTTGNTVIDAVAQHLPIAEKKMRARKLFLSEPFALATAHRSENVDDLIVLKNLMEAFAEAPLPVVYPMHPRTRKRLRQGGIHGKVREWRNIKILPPLGYLDFLILMKKCTLIVTDSGGIQEEATAPGIRKPVVVTRLSTERPEAVESGFAEVAGVDKEGILNAIESILKKPRELPHESPFGDGTAAETIAEIVSRQVIV